MASSSLLWMQASGSGCHRKKMSNSSSIRDYFSATRESSEDSFESKRVVFPASEPSSCSYQERGSLNNLTNLITFKMTAIRSVREGLRRVPSRVKRIVGLLVAINVAVWVIIIVVLCAVRFLS